MADLVDVSDEKLTVMLEADVAKIRNQAAQMPPGAPGECERCGEFSQRLVRNTCARCRDKYKLP